VLFVVGFPATLALVMWRYKEVIAEDQLLRAVGTGDNRRTNPNAYWMRQSLGSIYKAYKPGRELFVVVLFIRRGIVAVLMLLFTRNTVLQLVAVAITVAMAGSLQDAYWPMMSQAEVPAVLTQFAVAIQRGNKAAVRLQHTFVNLARGIGGQKLTRLIKPTAAFKSYDNRQSCFGRWLTGIADWNILALALQCCVVSCVLLVAAFQTTTVNDIHAIMTHYRSMDEGIGDTILLISSLSFSYAVFVVIYDVYTGLRAIVPKRFTTASSRLHSPSGNDKETIAWPAARQGQQRRKPRTTSGSDNRPRLAKASAQTAATADTFTSASATTTNERSAGATVVAVAANDAAATDPSPSVLSINPMAVATSPLRHARVTQMRLY
jgi:hypothetical protein